MTDPASPPFLAGLFPALATPFDGERASPEALRDNIARYEVVPLGGYLVLGSTGEAVFLDEGERDALLRASRRAIPPQKAMVAGVHAEATRVAVRQARAAADCGADAVLALTPHYFRDSMSEEALAAHYSAVADAAGVPLLLYNVPKFTGITLSPEFVRRASAHEHIAGIKESSGDSEYLRAVLAVVPSGFAVLCGDVGALPAAMRDGARGAVLAAAVAFPEPLGEVTRNPHDREALAKHALVLEASRWLIGHHGIAGLKATMDCRGLVGGDPRRPLLPLDAPARREIEALVDRLVHRGAIPQRSIGG